MVESQDKLAVVNTGSDTITIIDFKNCYECETIFLCSNQPYLGPHQIIKNKEGNIVYSANSYANNIFKIDLNMKQVEDALVVGSFPSHIDRLDNFLLVTNSDSNSISVIDEDAFEIIENISVGEKPHDIKVDSRTKKVYVANSNNNSINIIDIYSNNIEEIKLPYKPLHLVVEANRLYVLCPLNNGMINSKILILDIDNRKIIRNIDVDGVIIDMVIMEDEKNIYTTNIEDGCLYKIDISCKSSIEKYYIGGMPSKLLCNKKNNIFITNILNNTLIVFDNVKKEIVKRIKIGKEPNGLLFL